MSEGRIGLIIALATLITNVVMVIQNRRVRPKRQAKHRKRKR